MMFFKTLYSEVHGKYLQFSVTPIHVNTVAYDFMWNYVDPKDFSDVSGLVFSSSVFNDIDEEALYDVSGVSGKRFSSLEDCFSFHINFVMSHLSSFISIPKIDGLEIVHSVHSSGEEIIALRDGYRFEVSFAPSCCNLDYSPIVRLLGGIPA